MLQGLKMRPSRKRDCLIAVALAFVIGACATAPEPFEYHPENELKPGPGLLSGEDGVFTIYGRSAGDRANADLSETESDGAP
jgi:hypothetical protein